MTNKDIFDFITNILQLILIYQALMYQLFVRSDTSWAIPPQTWDFLAVFEVATASVQHIWGSDHVQYLCATAL